MGNWRSHYLSWHTFGNWCQRCHSHTGNHKWQKSQFSFLTVPQYKRFCHHKTYHQYTCSVLLSYRLEGLPMQHLFQRKQLPANYYLMLIQDHHPLRLQFCCWNPNLSLGSSYYVGGIWTAHLLQKGTTLIQGYQRQRRYYNTGMWRILPSWDQYLTLHPSHYSWQAPQWKVHCWVGLLKYRAGFRQ